MTNKKPKRLWLKRLVVGGTVLFGILAIAGSFYVRSVHNSLPELRTVDIERRDLVITVGTTGTIEPDEVVQVGPEVAGKIVRFGVDPDDKEKSIGVGARVSKGTVLFEIDPQQFEMGLQKAQAAYGLAAADIGRLKAQLAQASRNLQRATQLRATNTQSAFDEIQTAHEMAAAQLAVGQAKLKQAETEVRHAEIHIEQTTVRSPIDGIVIDRRANLGQHVHAGHPGLFLLSKDLDHMRIRASVSESDIGKVKLGQPATFTVDAHRDQTMTGRVDEILFNARRQGNFVTYDVVIGIDPTDIELFPHMTADVEFEVLRRDRAWLVPNGALRWWPDSKQLESEDPLVDRPPASDNARGPSEGEHACVWVAAADGRVRPLKVRVGVDDGVQTEVQGDGFAEQLPIVVGTVDRTTLARIIPTAKSIR